MLHSNGQRLVSIKNFIKLNYDHEYSSFNTPILNFLERGQENRTLRTGQYFSQIVQNYFDIHWPFHIFNNSNLIWLIDV